MFAPGYNAQATKRLLQKLDHLVLADQKQFLEKAIHYTGCRYDLIRRTTVFGVWAPHRQRKPLAVELFIPERRRQGTFFAYKRKVIPLVRFETSIKDIDFANDFYFVILSNIVPYEKPGKGYLYRFYDPNEASYVPDIYSHYQPFGVDGPSAVIAQYPLICLKRTYEKKMPVSITKLHIGTATPAGTFAGLQAELNKLFFSSRDTLEFLPIGAFPGRSGYQLTYYKEALIVGKVTEDRAINWGYDGGPNFICSVSESYGTPAQLKSLIRAAKLRGIKIGFDLQLNHYGPEGVYQNWYGPYVSSERTEWGHKPHFREPLVRRFLLAKIKDFVRTYCVDHVRLDMSSRYGDDEFIQELCTTLYPIPVILEDERNKPSLTSPNGAGALARWSFSTVHNLESIRHGRWSLLESTIDRIINKSHHSVTYATSHDEQGNNDAQPLADKLTPALAMMTNGIEMSWYSYGYFHFFCNYSDPVLLVKVTGEKCGVLAGLPDSVWPRMRPLYRYFSSMKDCRDFFHFLHGLWKTEGHDHGKIQNWIHNNNQLIGICEAYNQAIFELSNIKHGFVSVEFQNFYNQLKSVRKKHPWLYSDGRTENFFEYHKDQQKITIIRKDPVTKQSVTLMASLNTGAVEVFGDLVK